MTVKKTKYLLLLLLNLSNFLFASKIIEDPILWKHVVTIDRLVWEERSQVEKVNNLVDDNEFIRRVYLDIIGRIPTYEERLAYFKTKNINKRQELIENLLNSNGYVSNFTIFWQDLMRNPRSDPRFVHHREFTRYIERFLFENKAYDKIVYDMIMAQGTTQENPAVSFYFRDNATNVMDTLNSTIRAFLGTRIGCAQCHNHRFDKWTQKEFYETAAHFWGVNCYQVHGFAAAGLHSKLIKVLKEDPRLNKNLSVYQKRLWDPSRATVSFSKQTKLKYPDNYVYDNAAPNSIVTPKIVFGYGDLQLEGKTDREKFANWLTSKNNPMFSKIMANRLWKRIMQVSFLEPIDDWKDNLEISNPKLFDALGTIFVDLNYDFKAFLSVIFNSEAYQYAVNKQNIFEQDEYKVQGATLKRMSAAQLQDSLLTLQHGNIDRGSKLSYEYFEFEDKVNQLAHEYVTEVSPMLNAHLKKYGRENFVVNPEIIDLMIQYGDKLHEIEQYYNIGKDGYFKHSTSSTTKNLRQKKSENLKSQDTKNSSGSMTHTSKPSGVKRANYISTSLMTTFGMHDRSSPETNLETSATSKQILSMMNSEACKAASQPNSYLMKNALKYSKFTDKLTYLYFSIYGRSPNSKEVKIAKSFISDESDQKRWSKFTLAMLNSPEFYFIK